MRESYLDKLRNFIITFPRWDDYGIRPPKDRFITASQIAVEKFESSTAMTQLALRLDGSRIVRKARDVLGNQTIERRNSHTLLLIRNSGTSGTRADTSAFLEDFIAWMDEMDALGKTPQFGDEPAAQSVDVDDGSPASPWDSGDTTVYIVRIHVSYIKNYESEDY